ncbi:MAG: phosphopantothenoylcysteine decarboxylase, partial [Bacteroidota bacterium]
TTDIAILSAAVADYRPKNTSHKKIKKKAVSLHIELEPTKDILASLGALKKHQFLVGFALETDNELAHAKQKLKNKNLDAIVLNSLNDEGAGFGSPTNKITFIDKQSHTTAFKLKSKADVAKDIFNEILNRIHA